LKKYPHKEKIIRILGVHPYVFEKALIYKNTQPSVYRFFANLITIDRKAKI
jgi:hypothetical protein